MNKKIAHVLTGLGALVLLIGGYLVSFFGGAGGWPFFAAYLPAVLALAVSVRLPGFDGLNMIESTVEGQGFLATYVMPIVYPAVSFAMGWCLSFLVRLFGWA
jgi:hypothetical protein